MMEELALGLPVTWGWNYDTAHRSQVAKPELTEQMFTLQAEASPEAQRSTVAPQSQVLPAPPAGRLLMNLHYWQERERDRGPGKKAPEDTVGVADGMEFKNTCVIKIAS